MIRTSEMGPLGYKRTFRKGERLCRSWSEKEGAKLLVDGRNLKLQGYEKWLSILEDVYLIM